MAFSFRQAIRDGVHMIVGLIGGTGSGKTYSALRLATGLAGGKKIAVIDTEAGRARHYADRFAFDHGDLTPPFRPEAYGEAIIAAEEAGYPVIVVDSMSHEHAGEGGLLDWHDELLDEMVQRSVGRGDREWEAREKNNMRAWIEPKMAHKRMVQRLLQLRSHLILCFRAEEKIKMTKVGGKTVIEDAGWQPVCAKGLEFELTASFLLSHKHPGVAGEPLKLPEDLRQCFPPDQPISERTGEMVAQWAAGSGKVDPLPNKDGTLAVLLGAIEMAETLGELESCKPGPDATEADKAVARKAYLAKKTKLQKG